MDKIQASFTLTISW